MKLKKEKSIYTQRDSANFGNCVRKHLNFYIEVLFDSIYGKIKNKHFHRFNVGAM